ncbi:MAG: hypothetical protein PHP57_08030 [Sideroxydans sp.]|nr:hypothetical protein [Sideroxydans sp.]
MLLIDDKATLDEVGKRAPPSLRSELPEIIQRLLEAELVRDKDKLIIAPKLVVPKPLAPLMNEELDFTSMVAVPSAAVLAAEASKQKNIQEAAEKLRVEKELQAKKLEHEAMQRATQEAARIKAELEAAKVKSEQEASKTKADLEAAKARIEAEAKILAEARAKHEAETARLKAEQEAARLKIEQEAVLRLKAEEAERVKREVEAARIKKQIEVERLKAIEEAAKAKAELELVKARMEAEAKSLAEERARHEAEAARQKVEQEAARVKAEQEAISRAKAEAEEKIKKEAEAARVKEQQEQARIKAVQEAEKIRAELEEAKAKAEVEAKKLAEARAKQEAETARQKAEHEAARIKQEAETARQKAEHEAARIKQEAETARQKAELEAARIKQEAETARQKTELEAARIKQEQESAERAARDAEALLLKKQQEALRQKAEQDAINVKAELEAVKVKAQLDAKALAEVRVKQEAEAARQKAEFDAAKAKVEEEKSRVLVNEVADRLDSENQPTPEKKVANKDTFATRSGSFKIDLSALHINALSTAPKVDEIKSENAQLKQKEEERLLAEQSKLAEAEAAKREAAETKEKLKSELALAKSNAAQEAQIDIEEQALSSAQAQAWAEAEQRAKLQANVQTEKVVQQAPLTQGRATRSRSRSSSIPLGKIFVGLIFVSLIALFVLPLVWPMQNYIPVIEKRLSNQFTQVVKVGGISASLLPTPSLSLKNVVIGQGEEVKVDSVLLKFDVTKIFASQKAISEAELSSLVLDGKTFEQSLEWLSHVAADEHYPIRHMTLSSVTVATEGFKLPVLRGGVELSDQLVSRVVLHSEDEKMNIELLRGNSNWQISFGIKERSLPFVPQIIFSDFTAKGNLSHGEVVINQIDGHAYDGILSGNGKVSWLKGWQVQGRFQAKTMELVKILPQYGVTGEVFADGSYNLQSANLAQLGETPKVEVTFTAKKGSINGVDVVETARLGSRTHLLGGRTHFDEFTGTLQIENHHQRYRQLKIASGMLSASGSMDVAPNDQLSGSLNAEIKMRAGSSALALSGTSVEPRLQAK